MRTILGKINSKPRKTKHSTKINIRTSQGICLSAIAVGAVGDKLCLFEKGDHVIIYGIFDGTKIIIDGIKRIKGVNNV